jgi:hypothetical protein
MTESRFRAVKAYKNEEFMGSKDSRPLRILAEYLEPESRFEELRVRDAHLRLGFADEVMAGWFAAAGLEVDHVEHLEGGELTVTLWRGTKARASQRRAA